MISPGYYYSKENQNTITTLVQYYIFNVSTGKLEIMLPKLSLMGRVRSTFFREVHYINLVFLKQILDFKSHPTAPHVLRSILGE